MSTLEAVRDYMRQGWQPIPIPRGMKAAKVRDWPKLRLTEGEIPRVFSKNGNVGLLLGEASGGLVAVDLDDPVARKLAETFLPPTR